MSANLERPAAQSAQVRAFISDLGAHSEDLVDLLEDFPKD